jgi:hypothetical protein
VEEVDLGDSDKVMDWGVEADDLGADAECVTAL